MSRCLHRFTWLSLVIPPYPPSLLASLLDYILYPYRAVGGKFLLVARHLHLRVKGFIGVHRRTSLTSSSLLLQQWAACFVYLIWMVLEMGVKWPYSPCFVRYCFQDLFNIAYSIQPSKNYLTHYLCVYKQSKIRHHRFFYKIQSFLDTQNDIVEFFLD